MDGWMDLILIQLSLASKLNLTFQEAAQIRNDVAFHKAVFGYSKISGRTSRFGESSSRSTALE